MGRVYNQAQAALRIEVAVPGAAAGDIEASELGAPPPGLDGDALAGEQIAESHLRSLLAYWAGRVSRTFPSRRQIDPVDIPWILPHLMLMERNAKAGDSAVFRVRLAGTGLYDALGRELTGTYIEPSQAVSGVDGIMPSLLGEMLAHGGPVYGRGHMCSDGGLGLTVAGLAAPLNDDGGPSATGAVMAFSGFRYAAYDRSEAGASPLVRPVRPAVARGI
jgi:hypothetical protein